MYFRKCHVHCDPWVGCMCCLVSGFGVASGPHTLWTKILGTDFFRTRGKGRFSRFADLFFLCLCCCTIGRCGNKLERFATLSPSSLEVDRHDLSEALLVSPQKFCCAKLKPTVFDGAPHKRCRGRGLAGRLDCRLNWVHKLRQATISSSSTDPCTCAVPAPGVHGRTPLTRGVRFGFPAEKRNEPNRMPLGSSLILLPAGLPQRRSFWGCPSRSGAAGPLPGVQFGAGGQGGP